MEEKLQELDVVSEGVACITEHEGFTADLELLPGRLAITAS